MKKLVFFSKRSAIYSLLILVIITTLSYTAPHGNGDVVFGKQVTLSYGEFLNNVTGIDAEATPAAVAAVFVTAVVIGALVCVASTCHAQQQINVDFGEMSKTDFLLNKLP